MKIRSTVEFAGNVWPTQQAARVRIITEADESQWGHVRLKIDRDNISERDAELLRLMRRSGFSFLTWETKDNEGKCWAHIDAHVTLSNGGKSYERVKDWVRRLSQAVAHHSANPQGQGAAGGGGRKVLPKGS